MLKVGDLAPEFNLPDQNDRYHKLSDYKGKKVVLYFYPKDMTPGCTAQACNLTENIDILKKKGFTVLGMSADPVQKHKKFEEKYNLKFPLLSDTSKDIIDSYGVYGMKKFMGRSFLGIKRTTFIIGKDGKIEHIIDKVDTGDHSRQILDLVK